MENSCNSEVIRAAFLIPALIMAVIGPIVGIISQIVAVLVIKKVQTAWTAYKNRPYVVPTDTGSAGQNLP